MNIKKSIILLLICIAFAAIGCACSKEAGEDQSSGSGNSSSVVETIAIDVSEHTMNVGDTVRITADKDCNWSVSDDAVISVDDHGVVKAVGLGEATVTAEYKGAKATARIIVTDELLGEPALSVDLKGERLVVSESTEVFPIAVFGSKIADNSKLDYTVTSSDAGVVSVDGFKLTGVGEGSSTIKVELTYKGKNYTVEKTVTVRKVSDIWFEEEEISTVAGSEVALNINGVFSEENGLDKVRYEISDKSVLSYENGKYTALKPGTATVTASYNGISTECVVRVCTILSGAKDFLKVYDDPDGNYILLDDIDLKGIEFNQYRKPFSGYIDGNGYALKGMLFSQWITSMFTEFSGTIKNLSFEGVEFRGMNGFFIQTGIIAHTFDGARIENCRFDVKFYSVGSAQDSKDAIYVSWGMLTGVMASYNDGAVIKDCYISLSTPTNSKKDYIGAVVGLNRGELTLDNVIVEKAGDIGYAADNSGILRPLESSGVYARPVASKVAQVVFDNNTWITDDGEVVLKKHVKEFDGIVPYYVVYETENLYDGGYTEIAREKHYAILGSAVSTDTPNEAVYGYHFDASSSIMEAGNVKNGTELKLRFARDSFKVKLSYGGDQKEKTYKYQETCDLSEYSIKAPDVPGKTFIGWGKGAYEAFSVTGNIELSDPQYATEISSYNELLAIADAPDGNYVLTKDIDALADTGKSEVIWKMMDSFSGILDGNGYSIRNISLYNDDAPWTEKISMFDQFDGVLKDIGFANVFCAPTYSGFGNGIIAIEFSGIARNVYLEAKISKTYYQYNGQQYGALFGTVTDGTDIHDVVIDYRTYRDDNTVSPFGYVAGTLKGNVDMNGIVIVKEKGVVNENGSLFAFYDDGASINGASCNSSSRAEELFDGLIIDGRNVLIKKADNVLGCGWVCDGEEMPRLRKEGDALEIGDTIYTVECYFNSLDDPDNYVLNPDRTKIKKGKSDIYADISGALYTYPGYIVDTGRSTLTGIIKKDRSLVLSVYYSVNKFEVFTWNDFWAKVGSSATSADDNPYIVLAADLDPKGDAYEYLLQTPRDFYGVIDGRGHSVKNITLYQDNPEWYQEMAIFNNFTGDIKNISFVDIVYSQTSACLSNGSIARTFKGTAENIFVSSRIYKNFAQYPENTFGTIFGTIKNGTIIRNVLIYPTEAEPSNVYVYGYIAGTVNGSVTIENVVMVNAEHAVLFGYFYEATINGMVCRDNDQAAAALKGKYLIDTEANVIANAGNYLGSAWICDGMTLPKPFRPTDEESAFYTVKFYTNTMEEPTVFTERSGKELILVGKKGTIVTFDKDVGNIFKYYKIDEDNENNVLSGTVVAGGSLVLKVYCIFDNDQIIRVGDFQTFLSAVRSNSDAYIVLTDDLVFEKMQVTAVNINGENFKCIAKNFSGVIDGRGHKIGKEKEVYLSPDEGALDMFMFWKFSGTIKNIEIIAAEYSETSWGDPSGVIAREFSGVAENIKFTYTVYKLLSPGYYESMQGGLFGRLADGAVVRNVLIDFSSHGNDDLVEYFGYVAGIVMENASVTVENIVVVNRGTATRPIIALAYGNSSINGKTPPVEGAVCYDQTADAIYMNSYYITNALIGDETTVVENARNHLGSAWVCNGNDMPYLKEN